MAYEEVRKQQLEENKKRFQDLGILNIKKTLSDLTNSPNNSKPRISKPKATKNEEPFEPRRSSRARNSVVSYVDDLDIGHPAMRKRSSSKSSWDSYIARPADECVMASYEDRLRALKVAEEFLSNLPSGKPSFVKSMVRSHVYSCFWLGLPTQFCKDHLPKQDLDMILVDETGEEYDAKYLGKRAGLSGGWRGFALDHKLDDGDALVFELEEPDRFKIYTFRVSTCSDKNQDLNAVDNNKTSSAKDATKKSKKHDSQSKDAAKKSKKGDSHSGQTRKSKKAKVEQKDESLNTEESQQHEEAEDGSLDGPKPIKNDGAVSESVNIQESEPTFDNDGKIDGRVLRGRKKAAPKLFRNKA